MSISEKILELTSLQEYDLKNLQIESKTFVLYFNKSACQESIIFSWKISITEQKVANCNFNIELFGSSRRYQIIRGAEF